MSAVWVILAVIGFLAVSGLLAALVISYRRDSGYKPAHSARRQDKSPGSFLP